MSKRQTEFIVSAAIYDGYIISLPPPARHHTILHSMHLTGGEFIGPEKQGFITSTGRYVNRCEAYSIARCAKQFKKSISEFELFSEDLW